MSGVKTVLIIDDDVPFAEFLRAAVDSVGHHAVVCPEGPEALEAFIDAKPDLVFLDILLPGRDGFQVCEDIRQHPEGRDTPIVMMTGIYKKPVYEREALDKYGASSYVYKPLGVDDLWSLLEKYVGIASDQPLTTPEKDAIDLAEVPLARVLADYLERASSGVLFARGSTETYAFYLRYGEPFFVRSNVAAVRLHEVLLESWQVDTAQVEAAVQEVANSRGRVRLGQALVKTGAITPD